MTGKQMSHIVESISSTWSWQECLHEPRKCPRAPFLGYALWNYWPLNVYSLLLINNWIVVQSVFMKDYQINSFVTGCVQADTAPSGPDSGLTPVWYKCHSTNFTGATSDLHQRNWDQNWARWAVVTKSPHFLGCWIIRPFTERKKNTSPDTRTSIYNPKPGASFLEVKL